MSKCDRAASMTRRLAVLLLLLLSAATAAAARAQTGNDPCPRDYTPPGGKPLLMYVFGDSIMWGEGLADRNKFSCRVRNWLERQTGTPVVYRLFAHAGATVERADEKHDPDHFGQWWKKGGIGEINVSFPTINEQLDFAEERHGADSGEVDLVLINGCANDVNFRHMLDARNTPDFVSKLARCKCDRQTKALLRRVGERYPGARIFVTGYYPLVFRGRDPKKGDAEKIPGTTYNWLTKFAVTALVEDLGEPTGCDGSYALPSRPAEVPDELKREDKLLSHLEKLSQTWFDESNRLLQEAADAVPRRDGARRGYFVQLNLPPEFAFSTANSMLWNFRFNSLGLRGLPKAVAVLSEGIRTFDPNDEQKGEREKVCDAAVRQLRDEYKRRKQEYERNRKLHKRKEDEFGRRMKERRAKTLDPAEQAELSRGEDELEDEKEALDKFKKTADDFRQPCEYGSLGHPNRYGAALYAQAIISQLQVILPETDWLRRGDATSGGDPGRR